MTGTRQQAVTTPRPKGYEKEVGLLGPRRAQAIEEGLNHAVTQPFQEMPPRIEEAAKLYLDLFRLVSS